MKRISFEFLDANNKKKVKTDCRAVTSKKEPFLKKIFPTSQKKILLFSQNLFLPSIPITKRKIMKH